MGQDLKNIFLQRRHIYGNQVYEKVLNITNHQGNANQNHNEIITSHLLRWLLKNKQTKDYGTSLAVQWLRLCTSNAGGAGLIPGWGTKIPHATWYGQKLKKKNTQKNQKISVREDVQKPKPLYTVAGNLNDSATMENSLEIPQKIKYKTTILSSNSTSGYISRRIKIKMSRRC